MNFLSHYYLLEDKESIPKVVGNLLPDLMRGFTKIYRQEILPNQGEIDSALLDGISFHLLVDKVFHEHPFFVNQCEIIKQKIDDMAIETSRSFIVAHVMLELIIDQYLMEEDLVAVDEFYQTLVFAEEENTLTPLNFTLNRQNSSKIIRIFKSFIEHKYAYSITDGKGISQALHHIIGNRLGLDFLNQEWYESVDKISKEVKVGLPNFLIDLKQALKNA